MKAVTRRPASSLAYLFPKLQLCTQCGSTAEAPDTTLSSATGYVITWQVPETLSLTLCAQVNRRQVAKCLQSSQHAGLPSVQQE